MNIILDLFLTFLKIGAFSMGGGYGMIPLITEEVFSHGWLTEDMLLNFIAVSESTPGPIAINMATFIGYSQGGFLGALMATLGVVLPSFVIILLIAALIRGILKFAGVQAFLSGIRPVVVGLIVGIGVTMFLTVVISVETIADTAVLDWRALVIFIVNVIVYAMFKIWKKKNVSPIILICISAVLGIIFYGFLGAV